MLGQTVDIIYTEQDRQAGVPEAERQRALQHGQATDERWHARRDGSRCFLSGLLNPLVDGTGKVIGFAKIARDLTEERQRSSGTAERTGECAGGQPAEGPVLRRTLTS